MAADLVTWLRDGLVQAVREMWALLFVGPARQLRALVDPSWLD